MEEKSSKKIGIGVVIGIIIGVVVLGIIVLAVVFLISARNVNSTISNARVDSFISTYRTLERQVEINAINNTDPTCDGDCSLLYDYDDEDVDFEVTDMGTYYKLEFDVDDDKYRNFKFTDEACSVLQNAVCNETEISGRVNKEN